VLAPRRLIGIVALLTATVCGACQPQLQGRRGFVHGSSLAISTGALALATGATRADAAPMAATYSPSASDSDLVVSLASYGTRDVGAWLERVYAPLLAAGAPAPYGTPAVVRTIACKQPAGVGSGACVLTVLHKADLQALRAFEAGAFERARCDGLLEGKPHVHAFDTRFFKGAPGPPGPLRAGSGLLFGAHRTRSLELWTAAQSSAEVGGVLELLGASGSWCGALLGSTDVVLGKRSNNVAFLDVFPDGPAAAVERARRTRARGGMVASTYIAPGFAPADVFAGPLYTEPLEVLRDDPGPRRRS
jgi:hypothetical protein